MKWKPIPIPDTVTTFRDAQRIIEANAMGSIGQDDPRVVQARDFFARRAKPRRENKHREFGDDAMDHVDTIVHEIPV